MKTLVTAGFITSSAL